MNVKWISTLFFVFLWGGFFIWKTCKDGNWYPAISHQVWENDYPIPNGVSSYIRIHGKIVWSIEENNKDLNPEWVKAEKERQTRIANLWIDNLNHSKFELTDTPVILNKFASKASPEVIKHDLKTHTDSVIKASSLTNQALQMEREMQDLHIKYLESRDDKYRKRYNNLIKDRNELVDSAKLFGKVFDCRLF